MSTASTVSGVPRAACADCGQPLAEGPSGSVCNACLWGDADSAAPPPLTPGALNLRIPGHEVEVEIARGGMGIVYRALECEAERRVALKMLLPHLAGEPGMRERFRLEARAAAGLDHPAVLPVYHIGVADGVPYFTMKLAEGGSLADRLRARSEQSGQSGQSDRLNPTPPRAAAALMADLADAVQFAHSHGVLHRDLKPGNVLFDDKDRPYLSDFGLVKIVDSGSQLTRSRHFLGTPHYAAPEVAAASASEATTASDVWSLGAMLYELLAGSLPFEAAGVPALLRKIVDEPAPALPSGVPRDLAVICLKCLEKFPQQRFDSAGEFAADLRRWLDGHPIQARSVGVAERLWRCAVRNPATAALTAALLAVLGFLAFSIVRESRATATALIVSRNAEKTSREAESAALLAEARAIRRANDITRRDEALAAVRRSATLHPTTAARDELISLLALPAITHTANIPYPRWTPRPDGDLRLYVTLDKTACSIRDLATQREVARVPRLPASNFMPGPLSPDGKLLALRVEGGSEIWDIAQSIKLVTLPRLTGPITFSYNNMVSLGPHEGQPGPSILCDLRSTPPAVRTVDTLPPEWTLRALSPDGLLAVASPAPLPGLSLVDTATLAVVREYSADRTGVILPVLWSADSRSFLTGSLTGVAARWQVDTAQPLWTFPAHEGRLFSIALTHGDRILATQGHDNQLKFWDLATLSPRGSLPWPGLIIHGSREGSRLLVQRSDVSMSGVLSCTGSSICEMSAIPSTWAGNAHQPGTPRVMATPDSTGFAITSGSDFHRISARDASLLHTLNTGVANACAFDPLTGGCYVRAAKKLSLITSPSGAAIPLGPVPHGASLAFDAHSRRLLSGGPSGFRAWSIPAAGGVVNSLDQLSRTIVSLSGNQLPRLSKSVVQKFAPVELKASSLGLDRATSVTALAWSPSGRLIAWAGSARDKTKGVRIVEAATARDLVSLLPGEAITTIRFTSDEAALLAATTREIICCGIANGTVRWRIPHQRNAADPVCLAAAAGSQRLAAALTPDSVSLLDPATGSVLTTLTHPVTRTVRAFDISPDGTRLCVLAGTLVQIWNLDAVDASRTAPPRPESASGPAGR